jgi:hypothetical protein
MKLASVVLLFLAASATVLPLYGQTPAKGTSTEELDRSAMQVVCEGGVVNTDVGGHLQCAECPSYTDLPGQHESFRLEAAYRGHFFSIKDTDQLLLVLGGCGSNSRGLGGSVLLAREGAAWTMVTYFDAEHPNRCLALRASKGLDRLICETEDMHFGTGVAVLYPAYQSDPQPEPLLEIGSNMGVGTPVAGRWCYEQAITSLEKLPSDAGFTATITQSKGLLPDGEDFCQPDDKIRMEPEETIVLKFLFDGDQFVLAPESAAAMERTHFVTQP